MRSGTAAGGRAEAAGRNRGQDRRGRRREGGGVGRLGTGMGPGTSLRAWSTAGSAGAHGPGP